MTVMLCGLAEIRMDMSLLEMGVQLMILPATSFRTMNWRHPILVFRVFSAVPDLASFIFGAFSKPCPSDIGKAHNVSSIAF